MLDSAPVLEPEYAVSVAFWPRFREFLDRRPGRQLLFQQAALFCEVRVEPLGGAAVLCVLLAVLSVFEPILVLLAVGHGGAFEGSCLI